MRWLVTIRLIRVYIVFFYSVLYFVRTSFVLTMGIPEFKHGCVQRRNSGVKGLISIVTKDEEIYYQHNIEIGSYSYIRRKFIRHMQKRYRRMMM